MLAFELWCGFCGAVPEDSTPFTDVRQDQYLQSVVERCFFLASNDPKCIMACAPCESIIREIDRFTEQCVSIQGMFRELRENAHLEEEQLLDFRRQYLEAMASGPVVTEEVIHIVEEFEQQQGEEEEAEAEEEEAEEEVEPEETEILMANEGDLKVEEIDPQADSGASDAALVLGPRKRGRPRKTPVEPEKVSRLKCLSCHMTFESRKHLTEHEKAAHPKLRKFCCEQCGKQYSKRFDLNAHMKCHEGQPTVHQCAQCNKKFSSEARLNRHLEKHSPDKWVCAVCGMVLNTRPTYRQHMQVHSDVKRYKCAICEKDFKRQKAYKEHLIIHSGLRPYKCPFCVRTFVNGANCRSHKVKNHPEEVAALESSGMNAKVLEQCRNIPSMEELIAVSLQRLREG